ncbi:MAG: hypothetical protein KGI02_00305 [Thaumarchaeota archaeon]|nr:hypothetical protein [Nitrososphaerota archaeon]MDE1830789.1 hypothetical protein [Nitrososphaerota archaeon]MDE1840740.1 hypothetical protein [Nitrososphaerota archaeon]MDE1877777.1 hypothetical protein [Nitrososphaerota archaeon]
MPPKKAIIPVIFAAIGLVSTTLGMFTVHKELVWTGVGLWVASIASGKMLKRKPKID